MTKLEILNDAVHIDASIVAQGLGVEPSFVQTMMREGEITSLCERGADEDAGRHRLTFFHKSRRFRIIVDETGKVINRPENRQERVRRSRMIAEPTRKPHQDDHVRDTRERRYQEKALDEALKNTFPASDPVSVEQPTPPAADRDRAKASERAAQIGARSLGAGDTPGRETNSWLNRISCRATYVP